MRVTKIHILLFLLTAGLLAGCCGHNEPTEPIKHTGTEIAVRTGVKSMLKRSPGIDSNAALQAQDLKIDAYFHGTNTKYLDGTKLHYTGGDPAWKFWDGSTQLHYYWPFDGAVYDPSGANITYTSLDFVGYCPYAKPAYIGTLTYNHTTGTSFTCDMSSYMTKAEQEGMQEFVVAVLNAQTLETQTDADGALPLQFKHPLAQVKFVITDASGTHVQINSLKIENLYTTGTCTYNGTDLAWSALSGAADMMLEQELKIGTSTTETTPYFVIPNNYGTKYLTVNATWDDWSDVTITTYGADVEFNWEPGHIYTYNLTLDKVALKVDIQKYTEQW
jgi:hypothetical protein